MAPSKTPSTSKPHLSDDDYDHCSVDDQDIVTFFENLDLDEEVIGVSRNQATSSIHINGVANSLNHNNGVASSLNYNNGVAYSLNYTNGVANTFNYNNGVGSSSSYNNGVGSSSSYNNGVGSSSSYNKGAASSSSYNNGAASSLIYNNGVAGSLNYHNGAANSLNYNNGVTSSSNYNNGIAGSLDYNNGVSSSSSYNNAVANLLFSSYLPQPQVPNWGINQDPQILNHPNWPNNGFAIGGSPSYPYLPPYAGSSVGSNNHLNFELNRTDSGYGYPLMSTANQVQVESMYGNGGRGYNQRYSNQYSNQRSSATRRNGTSLGYERLTHNNSDLTSSISSQQSANFGKEDSLLLQERDILSMALDKDGSQFLQGALHSKNDEIKNTIFMGVCDHLFQLMADQYGQYLFRKLIDSYTTDNLQPMLEKLISKPDLLINAACISNGSKSIQKLVKKIKKAPLGCHLTKVLTPRFMHLATNTTARHVLKECLSFFSHQANKPLYEEAIKNFDALASHEVGCLALNDCIDYVSKAELRDELLNLVVDKTVFLAYDPSGNFVVQHAVCLKNPIYSRKICENLKGHYVQLCGKKFGSHLVEKCIESCPSGMTYAIAEILEKNKALELARNEYGNYVIQKALEITEHENIGLCTSLMNALLPALPDLESSRSSKKVVEKIKRFRMEFENHHGKESRY